MKNQFSSVKTFRLASGSTWTLTESNSVIGQMIINDLPAPKDFFSQNGSCHLLYPGEKRRPLRDWWERVKIVFWYLTHLPHLYTALKGTPERVLAGKRLEDATLEDLLIIEVINRFYYLAQLSMSVHRKGHGKCRTKNSEEFSNEFFTVCTDGKLTITLRGFYAPGSNYIQHLINAGMIDEVTDLDSPVSHLELTVENPETGHSFVLGILKKEN